MKQGIIHDVSIAHFPQYDMYFWAGLLPAPANASLHLALAR